MTRNLVATTTTGKVSGTEGDGFVSFLGIPYAEPPVGARRFRPPVPVPSWDGVRPADKIGAICPQPYDDLDRLIGVPDMRSSEADCLTVNVWTPDTDDHARPVLVWVHGGAYVTGSNAWEIYHGPSFARDGAVFVSVNYRLNAFGFLNLTELFPDSEHCLNLGIQDACLGLRWVQENISAFGGDPGRVTIFGESAGAGMVSSMLAAPAARGAFHRVIPQSGFTMNLLKPEQSTQVARNFCAATGVAPGDWDALLNLPVDRIVTAAADSPLMLKDVPGGPWLPWNNTLDADVLPKTGYAAVVAGETSGIDLLIGTTADENKLAWLVEAPDGSDYPIDRLDVDTVQRLLSVYRAAGRGAEDWEVAEAIVNDQSYLIPSIRAAEAHLEHGGRVFQYIFTWRTPVLDGRLGSCHALEVPFVFDRLDQPLFLGDAPPADAGRCHARRVDPFRGERRPERRITP